MSRKVLAVFSALVIAGATLAWAQIKFDHRIHVEEYLAGMSCDTCHLPDAPSIVPSREVCLDCHDDFIVDASTWGGISTHDVTWALSHGVQAKTGVMDCAACHQQNFCLDCHKSGFADEMGRFGNHMLNVHSSDFHVTHPLAARGNQQLCASCHEAKFCSDCHGRFGNRINPGSPSHKRTFGLGSGALIDAAHANIPRRNDPNFDISRCDDCHSATVARSMHDWSLGHAREARKSLATCQSCHPGGDTCIKCHSARGGAGGFNPHGKDWSDRAGRLKNASNGKTCRMCHVPGSF